MRRLSYGFTLVEMLIALSIIAIVTGSIVACLSGGIRIWERSKLYGRDEVDLSFATELLARDLANVVAWEGKPLEGLQERCAFPALARSAPSTPREPHWVTYRVVSGTPTELFREVASLESPDLPMLRESVLSVEGELLFRYSERPRLAADGLSGQAEWSNATNFPLFVFLARRGVEEPVWQIVRELRVPLALASPAEATP